MSHALALSKYQCNPCASSVIVALAQLVGVLRILFKKTGLYLRWQEQWAEPVRFCTFPLGD
jgi:hypothetical protein